MFSSSLMQLLSANKTATSHRGGRKISLFSWLLKPIISCRAITSVVQIRNKDSRLLRVISSFIVLSHHVSCKYVKGSMSTSIVRNNFGVRSPNEKSLNIYDHRREGDTNDIPRFNRDKGNNLRINARDTIAPMTD